MKRALFLAISIALICASCTSAVVAVKAKVVSIKLEGDYYATVEMQVDREYVREWTTNKKLNQIEGYVTARFIQDDFERLVVSGEIWLKCRSDWLGELDDNSCFIDYEHSDL